MNTKYTVGILLALVLVGLAFYIGKQSGDSTPSQVSQNDSVTPSTGGSTATTSASPSVGTSGTPTPAPKPAGAAGTGRVVVTIADEAISLESLQSLTVTISDMSVLGSKGWVKVSTTPRQLDLLDLHRTSQARLFADLGLSPGTYTGLRFAIGEVVVIEKDGVSSAKAWMPSHTLTLNTKLIVVKGKTSALSLDLISSKALFKALDGSYLFLPVVKVTSQHDIGAIQTLGGNTQLFNGLTDFDQTWGMDENGSLKVGFSFVAATQFEFLGKVLYVIPYDEKKSDSIFSAQSAVNAALQQFMYMNEALSVQMVLRQGKRVWQVTGTKGSGVVRVYLDIATGAVIAVE